MCGPIGIIKINKLKDWLSNFIQNSPQPGIGLEGLLLTETTWYWNLLYYSTEWEEADHKSTDWCQLNPSSLSVNANITKQK